MSRMMSFRAFLIAIALLGPNLHARGNAQGTSDSSVVNRKSAGLASETEVVQWTDRQVAIWAYHYAPTARLIEAERDAIARQVRPKNDEDQAGARLCHAVLSELSLHQRNEAAADAMKAYYRAVATKALFEPLRQIAPVLERLRKLSETANSLGLPGGDLELLEDQRLQFEDQWFQIDYGLQRIEDQLCQATNQAGSQGKSIELVSPLPVTFTGLQSTSESSLIETEIESLIVIAYQNRRDLAAIEGLCCRMNANSLPATRGLLGAIVPGMGIDLLGRSPFFAGAWGHRPDSRNLAARRKQCQLLLNDRRMQIAAEVRDTVTQLSLAQSRLNTARQRSRDKARFVSRIASGTEYELENLGAVERAQIEFFQLEAEKILRQQAVAEVLVELRRATGRVLEEPR